MKIIKKLLLLNLLWLIGCIPLKDVSGIKFTESIEMPDKNKPELFGISNEWMVEQFVDAKSVIQFSNLETGTIKGKYLMFYLPPSQYIPEQSLYSIITIYIKDGATQIGINPQGYLPRYMGSELYTSEQMTNEANRLISSYKDYLKTYKKF